MRLVLASNNAKKLAELASLLSALPMIELVSQSTLGIDEADEPHITFVENALAKARHAARQSGDAAIADDSGLCVNALGGAPGVISAHYAQTVFDAAADREMLRRQQDAANNRLLLQRLEGQRDRRASFVSTLVALRAVNDPEPLIAFGCWQGEILLAPRGEGGFGYDPLVFVPALDVTVAELPAEVKNRCSHRALAAAQMVSLMRERWGLEQGAMDGAAAIPPSASGRGQG